MNSLFQEFVIHSPDFEAAKFWVGNLGKTATHAVVFAQLYTPDGACHGLHSFIVQVQWAYLNEPFAYMYYFLSSELAILYDFPKTNHKTNLRF